MRQLQILEQVFPRGRHQARDPRVELAVAPAPFLAHQRDALGRHLRTPRNPGSDTEIGGGSLVMSA
jgi:hypothetical protein